MSMLETHRDFDRVLERFEAWWQGEIIDRPLLTVGCRTGRSPQLPEKHHADLRQRWMDIDYQLDCFEARLAASEFVADRFPTWMPNLGPDIVATCFGADLEFAEDTSWSKPVVDDVSGVTQLELDLDNSYWNWIRQATEASIQRGQGRWITGVTDLHLNGDLLAALRGPEALCMDYMDDLPAVQAALDHVAGPEETIYRDLQDRIAAADQPSTTWLTYLHDGPAYVSSCDFICMISPEMAARTIYPALEAECRWLERNIYHLDGPGALPHLPGLLQIDGIHAIQWVQGAGGGPAADWIDVYKQVQAAGRGININAKDFDDARTVCRELTPQGVWLSVGRSYTRDEIQAFCSDLQRWAGGGDL
jgi:hypothetical protein